MHGILCRLLSVGILLTILCLAEAAASTTIHFEPEEMLLDEKVNEIIPRTGCIDAILQPTCPLVPDVFRTIDGTCNNIGNPTFGAAETGFGRFVEPRYYDADGLNEPLGAGDQLNAPLLPNAFQVTQDYIIEQTKSKNNRHGIQHMFMQWGQFLDHDMTLAPESQGARCEDIQCNGSEEDFQAPCFPILAIPSRVPSRRNCIRFVRTAAVCQRSGDNLIPREQINVNTAYLDASMVYGSSETVQTALRDLTNDLGLLRVSNGNLLPIDNSALVAPLDLCLQFGSCFLAGDLRSNEQAALASIHTLFVREHNRIAKELKIINEHWDGERIYQETRKIVGALVQKITYEDWLPIIIGNRLSSYRGYMPDVDASISNEFAAAAFRMGHSLIRPTFDFLSANFDPVLPPIPLVQMYFNNTLIQSDGIEGFMYGAAGNSSQVVDSEIAIGVTQQLFEREQSNRVGLDLAALNVQRGRDHGLPGYGTYVRRCSRFGQRYPTRAVNASTFDDLAEVMQNTTVRNSLRDLYNDDPQNVDLWPAGLAETALPGGLLGPTFTCLFLDQFQRLRDGDRFFYLNRGVFTRPQREAIRRATLSRIMCENLNGIVSVSRNVFRDNFRPSCERIPRLDLEFWGD